MYIPSQQQTFGEVVGSRQDTRRPLKLWAEVTINGTVNTARLLNISQTGFLMAVEQVRPEPGAHLILHLPDERQAPAQAVWTGDGFAGANFCDPLGSAALASLLLRAEPDAPSPETLPEIRHRVARTQLQPERGFLVPVALAAGFWAIAGVLAVYLA